MPTISYSIGGEKHDISGKSGEEVVKMVEEEYAKQKKIKFKVKKVEEEEKYEKCEKCDIRLGTYDGTWEMKVDWCGKPMCGKCALGKAESKEIK